MDIRIAKLRWEHHPTGLGLQVASPRLSWRVECQSSNFPASWTQTSYKIAIKRTSREDVKIFEVASGSSVLVSWPDTPLVSGEVATAQVMALGAHSDASELNTDWSEWSSVEAGLLQSSDWEAQLITAPSSTEPKHADEVGLRPIRFRRTFDLPPHSGKARLYITAFGLYEAYINGKRIGDECLAPGWTAYQSRVQYQTFDVGELLQPGDKNILSIEASEGWYAGRILWGDGIRHFYGDKIAVLAQLNIFDTNETASPAFRLITDGSWECHQSPIVASDIYDGETYDLGQEVVDWHREGSWTAVDTLGPPTVDLVASSCPPVKITDKVKPVNIFESAEDTVIVDFGQNLVGKLSITQLSKPDGHRIRIRHAEVLEYGNLGIRPLRAAKQTDTIIFGGGRELQNWSPHFTFHGFRYIDIQGLSANEVTADIIGAFVMHTDMARTGTFQCSDDDLNQLHKNVVWSMRGNFVSIPTDCPQRDERLGWTGDIQVFTPTAAFLYDSAGMLSNWMRDVIIDQKAYGGVVPLVVPNAMKYGPWPPMPQAVWDDVIVILPWTVYNWSGDIQVLRESFAGMQDYLKSIIRGADSLWDASVWQLGDWLDPNAPPDDPGLARTDGALVADAYLVYVTGLMSKIAVVLDRAEEAATYANEANHLKQKFHDKYVTKAGLLVSDTQTALALALVFQIYDDSEQKKAAGDRLARLVRYAKFKVSTGFAGTPLILHALTEAGHSQIAYRMILETECPSWLYPVRMGATTIWERWDSMLPDGSINPGQMTSFNHYALGSVADWMHKVVGGLSPLEPGWKKFLVKPRPGGTLTKAEIEFASPYGLVSSRWELQEGGSLVLHLTVPLNTTAIVALPDGSEEKVIGSGLHEYTCKCGSDSPHEWPPKDLLTQFTDSALTVPTIVQH